jgi:ATP-binding cassette subfamily G (WHITE) protein 2 (SNQ2)
MLEAIGAGDPNYKGKDWGDVWASSSENEKLSREIQDIIADRRGASNDQSKDDRAYAMPLTTQLYAVIHRSFVAMWRDPEYVTGVFMLHIITGLFNSFTFWNLGNSQIDMQSRLFSVCEYYQLDSSDIHYSHRNMLTLRVLLVMTLTIAPPLIQQLQPRFLHFRDIYESREGSAKIYSWPAMVWGAILSEIPYRILSGTIYCKIYHSDVQLDKC